MHVWMRSPGLLKIDVEMVVRSLNMQPWHRQNLVGSSTYSHFEIELLLNMNVYQIGIHQSEFANLLSSVSVYIIPNGLMKRMSNCNRTPLGRDQQQWVSLADCHLVHNQNHHLPTQTSERLDKYEPQQELSLTVLTDESSMLLSNVRKNQRKIRFTDLQQFEKQNFPGRNTADTSMIVQSQKPRQRQKQSLRPSPRQSPIRGQTSQLQSLAKSLQYYRSQSQDFLLQSESVYGRQIDIINQYYQQLHLMLDVEKNKHYNNILVLKKNIQSMMKITSQMAEIYLEEIHCIIEDTKKHAGFEGGSVEKSMNKFKNFLNSYQPKDLGIYQFELGNIEDIKVNFQRLIRIEIPMTSVPSRRQKSQSMGPRLKVFSSDKVPLPRYSLSKCKELIIEEEGDLQYTDGEQSAENIYN